MKFRKFILLFTKYLLIFFILIFIILCVAFIYYSKKINYDLPERKTIEVYDQNNDLYLTVNNKNKQTHVLLSEISPYIIDCFISIEDKKFFEHKGIDVKRIFGALFINIRSKNLSEGASTITQQYARNLFLSNQKTFKRKIEEIFIAMNLESKYSKNEILEGYLNTIYFDHGIYGISDACHFYFNKNPKDISLSEAACLASIPKGPSYYSPINNFERNNLRKQLIINEVYKDGKITIEQRNASLSEELEFYGIINKTNNYMAPYYQDIIINELEKLNLDNYSSLKVYTSVDLSLTKILYDNYLKYHTNDDLQIGIVAIDPNNGNVLSVIGGTDYAKSTFNRATHALRQPGSTTKPFLYYAALENGFTPITTFYSEKTTFTIDNDEYAPTNFNDIYPNQDITMAYAMATSDNIYAMKTHLFLGTNTFCNTLKNFGITTKIEANPSLALGTSEMYLDELTTAYAKIASLGKDVTPIYITKIENEKGEVIYENKPSFTQKYSLETCYILSETMTNMFDNRIGINTSVTGASISSMLSKKYAAKSGSTNTDGWIIGYNQNIVLGIWCGYDNNKFISNKETRFIKYIWADSMEKYTANKQNNWYQTPNNVIPLTLNPVNGKFAVDNEYAKKLYFSVSNIPWYIFYL